VKGLRGQERERVQDTTARKVVLGEVYGGVYVLHGCWGRKGVTRFISDALFRHGDNAAKAKQPHSLVPVALRSSADDQYKTPDLG